MTDDDKTLPDDDAGTLNQEVFNRLLAMVPHLNSDGSIPTNPMTNLFTLFDANTHRLDIILTRAGLSSPAKISFSEKELARHILNLQRQLLHMRRHTPQQ